MKVSLSIITPSIRPKGLEVTKHALEQQTMQNFQWIPKLSEVGDKPDLCRSMNEAISEAKGTHIVFLQDYITPDKDAMERIALLLEERPSFAYTFPVGKLRKNGKVKWDWRAHRASGGIGYPEWEIDFGAVPTSWLHEVGGFDEEYDSGFGWENVDLACRLYRSGHPFMLESSIKSVAVDHDKLEKHPYKDNPNSQLWSEKEPYIMAGNVDVKCL